MDLFKYKDEKPNLHALAYSPDSNSIAYGAIYPAKLGVRDAELMEIGIINKDRGQEHVLVEVDGGTYIVPNSLEWSPDGNKLIWVANVIDNEWNPEAQLWIADINSGKAKILIIPARSVQYSHPAVWSPDGTSIAFIKIENNTLDMKSAENVFLIDPITETLTQLTQFTDRKASHLQWSPDGNWIAYTLTIGEYSEIWVADTKGNHYPIAGPSLPNTPFIMIP